MDISKTLRATALLLGLTLPELASAQLVVTEVMYNPRNDNFWEWIEVKNTGSTAVDLAGYIAARMGDPDQVSPRITIDPTYAENTVIGAGQVGVIYDANYGPVSNPLADPNSFVDANFRAAWGLDETVPLVGANAWPVLANDSGDSGQSIGFWPSATDWRADMSDTGGVDAVTTSFAHAAFSLNFSGPLFPEDDGKSSITWTGQGANSDGSTWVKSAAGDETDATTSSQVLVPGLLNNPSDLGNPGIVPPGTPAEPGLHITEIMYDPSSGYPGSDWEWIEVYNSTEDDLSLAGWVLDNDNFTPGQLSAQNITTGMVLAGQTAILYNSEQTEFAAAWGETLNLIPVSNWSSLALGNGGDQIALWDSYADYNNNPDEYYRQEYAELVQNFEEANGYPSLQNGSSINLTDLSLNPASSSSWLNANESDGVSFHAMGIPDASFMVPLHQGGDVGSPGTFIPLTEPLVGDFDGDGDVDGFDFLEWQRGLSPDPLSLDDLADWQEHYGESSSAQVGSVPEPGSWVLLAAITPWLLVRSGRSWSQRIVA